MKTIKVSKGIKEAVVDDEDFERLSQHKWFLDQKHIYTTLSFSSGKTVGHSTFSLKVRMDFFIFLYTPHINAKIKHIDDDPYNCQKKNLDVQIKDAGSSQVRRTIFLGVVHTPKKSVGKHPATESRYVQLQAGCETYTKVEDIVRGGNTPYRLAEGYDLDTRTEYGNEARINFLLPVLPHKRSMISDVNGEINQSEKN
jgi:hypothetical protein